MARIKLPYVNGFSNRDRKSQRVRYYFRRRGIKAIPLPGVPGSEEFMAAYSAALASVLDEHLEIGANRTLPGTINALIVMCGVRSQMKQRRRATESLNVSVRSTAKSVSRFFSANTL